MTEVPRGSPDGEPEDQRRALLGLLTRAYWMEIETVMSYLAASMSHEGGRVLALRAALTESVEEEVGHARALGRRIQELHGAVPAAHDLARARESPQRPAGRDDARAMIESVVATESSAIRHYLRIMRASAQIDLDTNALALEILRDEQRHQRVFEEYLREYVPATQASTRANALRKPSV